MTTNGNENGSFNAIKEHVKRWKKAFTEGLSDVTEDSSWQEILRQPWFCNRFNLLQAVNNATSQYGTFTAEELDYFQSLPAYCYLSNGYQISNEKMYVEKFMEQDIPYVVCTVETEREELWNFDIFSYNDIFSAPMYIIINYAKEVPILKNVPKKEGYQCNVVIAEYSHNTDDLPF